MASPWAMDGKNRYFVEPFFSLDWINVWQDSYTETGKAGLNLKIRDWYSSLLQSEAGLRFYERFAYGWGDLCLEEKLSYINQAPFHFNSVVTSFVGAASSFPIAVGSSRVENLAALQLSGSFEPKNRSYPYGGIDFQVTGNGSYQAYFVNVFCGKDF
jgi:outer membrane autotransporter protein